MRGTLLAAILWPVALHAAVDGTVVNKTTGKPEANTVVTLMKLGQGMQNVGSVKTDAQGKFVFTVDADAQAPMLVQASKAGVNYNKMLPPGTSRSGVALDVFETRSNAPDVKLSQHIYFLEPTEKGLTVQELFGFANEGNVTLSNPEKGSLQFYLPPAAKGNVHVSVQGSQGMSIPSEAQSIGKADIYKVTYPVKPGGARFTVEYELPDAAAFSSKSLVDMPVEVVTPAGVEASGSGLEKLGVHPQTQATLYRTSSRNIALQLTGAARPSAAAGAGDGGGGNDESGGVDVKNPLIYARLGWILGLLGAMFVIGFVILYRKQPASRG